MDKNDSQVCLAYPKTTSEDRFPKPSTPVKSHQLHTSTSSTLAPILSQPSRLFACDIARYSDTELDQYLEDNGRLGLPGPFLFSEFAEVHTQTR